VPFIVTPKIVVELFRLQKISFKKARGSLEKLSKIGRYSPEIIAEALISLKEK
jgi:predicted RNA-binding protein (virulence factor B family)